jgi:glycosyltransferase involved in cell wall biosynthesis
MELTIVVPCYNEQEVLPETLRRLMPLIADLVARGKILADSGVVLVDDGSKDRTWSLISEAAAADPRVRGVKLSRNRGHQYAMMAGLFRASGDAVISIDADLQDDLGAIEKMVDAHAKGADIVYGVRAQRQVDTFFKRFTAEGYYRLLDLLGVEVMFNHADYRLLSRRALEALKQYDESNLFLRAIIPQLGFPSAVVTYDRAERFAGESKYPLGKMISLAWQGVTSFSAAPLRAITTAGVLISIGSFVVVLWALWVRFFGNASVPGWASTVVPMYFLGGVQLLCIGIIGEYLAKIYAETKRRPRYFIEAEMNIPRARAAPGIAAPAARLDCGCDDRAVERIAVGASEPSA